MKSNLHDLRHSPADPAFCLLLYLLLFYRGRGGFLSCCRSNVTARSGCSELSRPVWKRYVDARGRWSKAFLRGAGLALVASLEVG